MSNERGATTTVVTGAAGFIGSHLLGALTRAGCRVVAIDKTWARPDTGVPALAAGPGMLRRCQADLRTDDLGPLIAGADVVFHLAALPGVRPSWSQFDAYVDANVVATQRLLDRCLEAGVRRLVLASSSSVYGDTSGPTSEDSLPRPISPYAVTKLAAEQLALAYAARPDSDLSVIVLRFFTVYGPGQRPDMLIQRAVRAALTGGRLDVYGDGSQRRDFVYVEDVVRANLLAIHADVDSQVFNVGSAHTVSINEVLETIGEVAGVRPDVRFSAPRPGDVLVTCADLSRTMRCLGYEPTTPLRAGLTAQVAFERRRRTTYVPPDHRGLRETSCVAS